MKLEHILYQNVLFLSITSIVLRVGVAAVVVYFLLHGLGKRVLETQQVIHGDVARLRKVGHDLAAKLQKHGLGKVGLAALPVQPAGKLQIRPVEFEKANVSNSRSKIRPSRINRLAQG